VSLLTTKNLTKIYRQGDIDIFATKKVNISIEQGELLAITGKSGSGKTTLLNLLGGIDRPTSGTVIIDGIDIYSTDDNKLSIIRRQKIGYIFQNYNLIPVLTAKENIIMPLLLDSKKPDTTYIEKLVDILDIGNRLSHLPSELSGGQQQRVAIARALINHPSIILADEPTGNLDKSTADDIMQLLIEVHKMGNTVVLVTHEEKYSDMCQRKIHISDGEILDS